MPNRNRFILPLVLAAGLLGVTSVRGADAGELQRSFEEPPDDARIMMRWWWFGPAVTKTELEREMRLMKIGGIGGFEVQPTYPLALDDPKTGFRNLPFLSDEFIDALRFTSEKARELGLRMDLTVGSGWPYGGPQISVDYAAAKLRCARVRTDVQSRQVSLPGLKDGEKLITIFAAPLRGNAIDAQALREVGDSGEGVIRLPDDIALPAEVLFFISSRTGMQVKRPAAGAEGFVLNHYDQVSLDHYLRTVGDRLMQAFGPLLPYAVFCDSLEVNQSDWTGDLLAEFQKRRGYDLKPYLPALVMDIGPNTADIRYDWGRTLTELYEERFAAPLLEWAHRNRTQFRIQGYGTPPASLSSYAFADLPEGEGHQWNSFSTSRWAASASHFLGRPITSSETWTWLHSPAFRASPLDMKAEADRHFLQGINQLIGHGWPYTAEGVGYPGWSFYAAAVFDEKNPWWMVMPDVALYLQRASHLLRQGTPANEVALYLPTSDAYAQFQNERVELSGTVSRLLGAQVVPQILAAGFNFDFLDDGLLGRARLTKGALAFDSVRTRAVILPGVERIPAASLRMLEAFAQLGGVVIATRRLPSLAPGLKATEAERQEVRDLARRLFEGPDAPGVFVERESDLGKALAARLRPDVTLTPAAPDVGFVHRSAGDAEIYFLANTGNVTQRVRAAFRVEGLQPEWWDPMTGQVSAAEVLERQAGSTVVTAEFPPYGSRFLVFTKRLLPPPALAAASVVPAPLDLSGGWRVTFEQNPTPVEMAALRSWTENEETRHFSGVAIYEKEITVPASMAAQGLRLWLNFGEGRPSPPAKPGARFQALLDAPVREAAVLYVNDERAGSAWCPPYSVEVTGRLKAGLNRIRVAVGNLAVNYMAGRPLPDYKLLNQRYGVRFEPQDVKDIQPVPSGLLGPIRLVATSR